MNNKLNYDNNNININSFLSAIFKLIGLCLSFSTATLLLFCLGDEKYGIWETMLSLFSWIYFFDLGIGNGLRNSLSKSLVRQDYVSARKSLCVSYFWVSIITSVGAIIFVILVYFLNLDRFLGIVYSGENIKKSIIAAGILACLNFVLSLSNSILYAF